MYWWNQTIDVPLARRLLRAVWGLFALLVVVISVILLTVISDFGWPMAGGLGMLVFVIGAYAIAHYTPWIDSQAHVCAHGIVRHPATGSWQVWLMLPSGKIGWVRAYAEETQAEAVGQRIQEAIQRRDIYRKRKVSALLQQLTAPTATGLQPTRYPIAEERIGEELRRAVKESR